MSNRKQALHILKKLRHAGFEALFAGGCVRDMLLRRRANDYDVVTNAVPGQILRLFRKTLKIGAQFGVVMVLLDGKQIEVATFRTEGDYADGRHPNHVEFATARQDAIRRDFTINGMFYDPIRRHVLDFVGGQKDIEKKIICTIGPAHERFGEDYLRMLRALRFAVRFDFEIEKQTWLAIIELAGKIANISAERIAAEIEGILMTNNRKRGAQLLRDSGLIWQVFPGLKERQITFGAQVIGYMPKKMDWPAVLAGFFADIDYHNAMEYLKRLKFSNEVIKHVGFLLKNLGVVLEKDMPLAKLKMLAAEPYFENLLELQKAIQKAAGQGFGNLKIVKKRVSEIEKKDLKPRPLIDGHELISLGAVPGPMVGKLHREMYIAQLSEEIVSSAQARVWVKNWLKKHQNQCQ